MAKKQNKVSVNKMDKITDCNCIEPKLIEVKVDDEVITIDVLPYLTLKQRGEFIIDVADSVFIDGTYAPYMLNFAYKYFLLEHYTNLTMSKNSEKVNKFIQVTDIADKVDDIVDDKYLYSDCLDMIEYRKNVYLNNRKTDEFMDALISLVTHLDELSQSDEFNGKNLNKLVDVVVQFAGKDEKTIVNNVLDFQKAKNAQKSE